MSLFWMANVGCDMKVLLVVDTTRPSNLMMKERSLQFISYWSGLSTDGTDTHESGLRQLSHLRAFPAASPRV